MFDEITERIETEAPEQHAKVRLFLGSGHIKPALVVHLGKKVMEKLPGWAKDIRVSLAVGTNEDANKIRITKQGNQPIAKVSIVGLGSALINFGHVPQFGAYARPSKKAIVTIVSDYQIIIEMPKWEDHETGNGERKQKAKKQNQDKITVTPTPQGTGASFRIDPPAPKIPEQKIEGQGRLIATHDLGIKVYRNMIEYKGKLQISQTQAAILCTLTRFFDQAVSAARCIDLGFREIQEEPSQIAYSLVPTQLAEIAPKLRNIGLVLVHMKGVGFKLTTLGVGP